MGSLKFKDYDLPCRLDRNQFGDGIMVFVREDIPSRALSLNKSIESILTEAIFQTTLTY